MDGTLAAFGATGLYYVGFAVFKVAADRMEPVRGHRVHHMAWVILRSWIFLGGLVLVLGGLSLQIIALGELTLGVAVPIFVSGLVPLLLIALTVFGERLTLREWASLLLVAAAMLLLALSIEAPHPIDAGEVEPWRLAAVVVPPLAVSLALMALGDRRPDGRHARPVTGIAYGMSAGFPIGTAELAIKGWGDSTAPGLEILRTPYPYLTVLAAALGFGIIIVGFQRCRVSVVATVMTVSAKTYLLVMGTILYGEPWPDEAGQAALRVLALALAVGAVLLFPRHDDRAHSRHSPERDDGDPETPDPGQAPASALQGPPVPDPRGSDAPGPPRTPPAGPQRVQAPEPQWLPAPEPQQAAQPRQAPEPQRAPRPRPAPEPAPEIRRPYRPGPQRPPVPESRQPSAAEGGRPHTPKYGRPRTLDHDAPGEERP
ncbi:hypothetical protein [Thermomonospora echinospora]|nr:hypothetical protein [Thermomonospora echinospora]